MCDHVACDTHRIDDVLTTFVRTILDEVDHLISGEPPTNDRPHRFERRQLLEHLHDHRAHRLQSVFFSHV